jgi:splicing factor 1
MARDCPDRQRGTNWRNDDRAGGPPGRPAARIDAGDAVDREYEQLMQELSGGASGVPQQRIEAGPGGYDNAGSNGGSSAPPWQQRGGATGGPAPWRNREDRGDTGASGGPPPWAAGGNRGGRDNGDSYGGYNVQGGNYGQQQGGGGGAAPWNQAANAVPAQPATTAADYAGYDWAAYYAAAAAAGYTMPAGYAAAAQPPPPPGDAPPPPVSLY